MIPDRNPYLAGIEWRDGDLYSPDSKPNTKIRVFNAQLHALDASIIPPGSYVRSAEGFVSLLSEISSKFPQSVNAAAKWKVSLKL